MKFSRVAKVSAFSSLLLLACGGEETGGVPPQVPPPPTVVPTVEPPPAPTAVAPPPKPPLADLINEATQTALIALNGHDAKKFASVYAENAEISVPGLNDVTGRAGVEANMTEWFQTFSKVKLGFRRVWMKDKVVVLEWVIQGTHSGELFGVKGKDNAIGHVGLSIVTFNDDGKVQSEHRYGDLGTVAAQLGLTKDKAEAIPSVPETTDVFKSKPEADAKSEAAAKTALSAMEKKNPADLDAVTQDDIEYEGLITKSTVKGRADLKKTFGAFYKAFPDAKMTPSLVLGVGDFAVVEYLMAGTQQGPIGSIKATKKPVSLHAVDIMQFKDGKVSRVWTFRNSAELMQQLNMFNVAVVTPKAAAAAPTSKKK